MGNSSSQNNALVVAKCSIPAYVVKVVGSRHFLVAGGGGVTKTGVKNRIELYLLTYDQISDNVIEVAKKNPLRAKEMGAIDTNIHANMNMDVIAVNAPQFGEYLIAVGQDQYCALYETMGFCLSENDEDRAKLSLRLSGVCRFQTDWHKNDPYQKCVKLYRLGSADNKHAYRLVTSGADGHVRVWDASQLLPAYSKKPAIGETYGDDDDELFNSEDENQLSLAEVDAPTAEVEFYIGGECSDLDVSSAGGVICTVSNGSVCLWNAGTGMKFMTLDGISHVDSKAKIRSAKFLNLDKNGRSEILICAYNSRIGGSKEASYLALWAYEKKKNDCHLISVNKACAESIACLSVSDSGDFIAIGTLSGSVGVFDTHNLKRALYFKRASHASFVTAVEFLPHRSYDSKDCGRISSDDDAKKQTDVFAGQCFLPGICSADARTAVLSISVDNSIQVHHVAYPPKSTFTGFLVKLGIWSCLFYLLIWFLFLY